MSYGNEKTAVSISLVIDYKINSCIPFRNTQEVLKSLLCVVCVLKVHATSSSDTVRHTVLVERWTNSLSSDRCLILKMNSLFFDFSDFFKSRSFIFADWRSTAKTAKITCPRKYHVLQYYYQAYYFYCYYEYWFYIKKLCLMIAVDIRRSIYVK